MNIGWVFSFSICMLFTFCLDAMEGSSTGNITRSPFSLETMHEYTLKEVAQHLPTNFAKGINIFDQESTKKARSLFDTTYQRFQEKNISLDEYSELLLKNSIYYNNQACNKENLPSKKLFRTHLGIFRHYTKQKVIHCFGNTVYTKLQEFSRKKRYGMGDYDRHTLLIQDLENKLSNDPNFATSISNLINTSAAVDRVTLRKHISDHFLISHSKKIPWKVEIVNNWTSPLTIHTAYHWYETALFFLSLHTLSAAATSSNSIKEKNDLLDGLPPEQAPPLAARDGAILLLEKWKKEVAHFFNTFYLLCPSLKENISNNATSKTKLIWKSWEVEDIISEGSYFYNLPSEILTQITDMIVRPEEAFLYYANNKMKAIEHASSMKDIIISLNESIQYLHNHLDTLKKT